MVYYVEDDTNLRELTIYALKQAGIEALGLKDDAELRRQCHVRKPHVLLLDIMLPAVSGLDILKRIRSDKELKDIPVMMLTAKDAELDIVYALDAGADDYLTKPFGMMELVSRTRALLRRSAAYQRFQKEQERSTLPLTIGPLSLSRASHKVMLGSEDVELTQREFDLLAYLMEHADHVCTRDKLLLEVWGWEFDGGTRTVDVHIQQLRSKLASIADAIETVRGQGYCLRPVHVTLEPHE